MLRYSQEGKKGRCRSERAGGIEILSAKTFRNTSTQFFALELSCFGHGSKGPRGILRDLEKGRVILNLFCTKRCCILYQMRCMHDLMSSLKLKSMPDNLKVLFDR
ncbi:unnamed protein product [Pylaiella littoralis]